MTDNELELLRMIRISENPEKALEIGFNLLIDFLDERETPQHKHLAPPLATA